MVSWAKYFLNEEKVLITIRPMETSWSHVDWRDAFREKKEKHTLRITVNIIPPHTWVRINGSSCGIKLNRGQTYFFILDESPTPKKFMFTVRSQAGLIIRKYILLEPGKEVAMRLDETWRNNFYFWLSGTGTCVVMGGEIV